MVQPRYVVTPIWGARIEMPPEHRSATALSVIPFTRNADQSCPYTIVAEQKARLTYDNILRLSDDPDVNNVIRFLREREIVHFQRFGECLRLCKEKMDAKNVYLTNPAFDKQAPAQPQPRAAAHG